jgi:hypothetical protein
MSSQTDQPSLSVDQARRRKSLQTIKANPTKTVGRIPKLERITPSDYQEFLNSVRLGAYDYVAAERLGVRYTTFGRWMAVGRSLYDQIEEARTQDLPEPTLNNREALYLKFYIDVMEAKAEAREDAEHLVKKDTPAVWLRNTARTLPGRAGWTEEMNHNLECSFDVKREVGQTKDYLEIGGDELASVLNVFAEMGLLHLTEAGRQTLLGHVVPTDGDQAADDRG